MPIFKNHNGNLTKLSILPLSKEKKLQHLLETNLETVLGMKFLATEYTTTFGGRIDTLAVDDTGAPVIIEYKRNRNDNVINQGLSYLKWLQAQKVEFFEMLMIKKLGRSNAEKIKVDWKNPRVVCIAESYSKFDIDTVEVIPMRIELFKYRYYENGIFSLEPLGAVDQKIKTSKNSVVKPVTENSVENLLKNTSQPIKELWNELRSRIIELDENIQEKVTQAYIAHRITKNFSEIHIGKNHLKIHLRPVSYNDPKKLITKMPESYNWTMDSRVYLKSKDDLDYVFSLIEQSCKDVL